MMGGFGSGRTSGFLGGDKVENCRSIDVNRLHREGSLRAGWSGRLAMGRVTAEKGRLDHSAGPKRTGCICHIACALTVANGRMWTRPSTSSACPAVFGGARAYFICPGVINGVELRTTRRQAVRRGARYFVCRHCYRLSYASQSEGEWDRAVRRASKDQASALAASLTRRDMFPKRPKGMWRRTYERLRPGAPLTTEMLADQAFEASGPSELAPLGYRNVAGPDSKKDHRHRPGCRPQLSRSYSNGTQTGQCSLREAGA